VVRDSRSRLVLILPYGYDHLVWDAASPRLPPSTFPHHNTSFDSSCTVTRLHLDVGMDIPGFGVWRGGTWFPTSSSKGDPRECPKKET
jgi:hypothetical protein